MKPFLYEYYHDKDTHLTVRHTKSEPTYGYLLHFHRSIELLYVLDGEMNCEVGGQKLIAKTDDIVFVHGYYHHTFTTGSGYEKIFLIIPSNYSNDFDKIFSKSTLPALMNDKEFNRTFIRDIVLKMSAESSTMPPLVQKGYLNVLLGNLLAHYPTGSVELDSSIDLLVGVLNYIDEHCTDHITLDSLAATFGYNKYYFSRLFNKYIGESITNYINIVRLQRFMSITRTEENTSIAERAFSCGFDSLTTFYRYFNKMYDGSPKAISSGK